MVGTDFTNAFAPLSPAYVERLAALGDRVVLGADFPNIPYPYARQIEALDRPRARRRLDARSSLAQRRPADAVGLRLIPVRAGGAS